MKLSELMEKYGDIELENWQEKIATVDLTDRVNKLVDRAYDVITKHLRLNGFCFVGMSKIIMDINCNLHIHNTNNDLYYSDCLSKISLFINIVYCVSEGNWCYDEDDEQENIAQLIEDFVEEQEEETLDEIDRLLDSLE